MQPRDYQQEAINFILSRDDHVLRSNFTGTGKTLEQVKIIEHYLPQGRVWAIAPKGYLLDKLGSFFYDRCSVLKASKRCNWAKPLTLCSIQTLYNRIDKIIDLGLIPKVAIFDECHGLKAKTHKTVVEKLQTNGVRCVGWSATPCRLDGKGFDDIFDVLFTNRSYQWYIDNHYLSDYQIPIINRYLKTFSKSMGEINLKEQNEYYNNKTITTDAVEAWEKYTPGEKTITFCCSIDHAEQVAAKYNELGNKLYGKNIAIAVSANTPEEQRRKVINRMSRPISDPEGLLIITNFNLVSEGLDIPSVSVTQWLRQTASEVLYDQGNGRSNRYVPGKIQTILDHVGNIEHHGLPCRFRFYDLKARKKKKKKQVICLNCERPFKDIELVSEALHKDVNGKLYAMCSSCNFLTLIKDPTEPFTPRDRETLPKEEIEEIGQLEYLDKTKAKKLDNKKLLLNTWNRARGKKNKFFDYLSVIPDLNLQHYKQAAQMFNIDSQDMFSGYSKRIHRGRK